jgi:transposase
VDLDSGRPITLLDDRSADQVAAWLQDHPEVRVVSRDRGQVYIEGATRGAPQAVQVADKWHLLVRRITHPSISIGDGKGSEERLWVNGLPHGKS